MEEKQLDQQLDEISRVVKRVTGINLNSGKRELIKARLGNRLRTLGFTTYAEYLEYLYRKNTKEFEFLVDALTTNVTSFFREPRHFEILAQTILAPKAKLGQFKKFRFWSAGCSSGEEPYSVAITFLQTVANAPQWDFKILATDLSSKILARAKQGIYRHTTIAAIPGGGQARYFKMIAREPEKICQIDPQIKNLIHFARLNLLAEWPMKEYFDVIFCRNVMIYFERDVREKIIRKFWSLLNPGGWLFVGQSESLLDAAKDCFKFYEPAVYQKIE